MKTVTETVVGHILLSKPGAEIVERDGKRVIRIPGYDIDNDKAWWDEREVVPDPAETRQGVLPVFGVRTGAKFAPGGDVRQSPLGHLFRIIGYTPPKKDDDG